MTRGAAYKYGDWHVAFLDSDSSFADKQAHSKETAETMVFQNIGYAMLEGGKNPDKPYLFIAGYSEEAFSTLPVILLSGRLPENSSEILVSGSVAANGGVSYVVGDTISITVGKRYAGEKELGQHEPYRSGEETLVPVKKKTYTVTGIYQRPAWEECSAPGYTLLTTLHGKPWRFCLMTFCCNRTSFSDFGIQSFCQSSELQQPSNPLVTLAAVF